MPRIMTRTLPSRLVRLLLYFTLKPALVLSPATPAYWPADAWLIKCPPPVIMLLIGCETVITASSSDVFRW